MCSCFSCRRPIPSWRSVFASVGCSSTAAFASSSRACISWLNLNCLLQDGFWSSGSATVDRFLCSRLISSLASWSWSCCDCTSAVKCLAQTGVATSPAPRDDEGVGWEEDDDDAGGDDGAREDDGLPEAAEPREERDVPLDDRARPDILGKKQTEKLWQWQLSSAETSIDWRSARPVVLDIPSGAIFSLPGKHALRSSSRATALIAAAPPPSCVHIRDCFHRKKRASHSIFLPLYAEHCFRFE